MSEFEDSIQRLALQKRTARRKRHLNLLLGSMLLALATLSLYLQTWWGNALGLFLTPAGLGYIIVWTILQVVAYFQDHP